MAKNIEINILTDDTNKTYEILYPKVDLTNNQGTALPIDSTSGSISIANRTTGNLPSSRLSAGTLSGNFTFTTPPYCSTSPSSSYYLANKAYVDSVANSGGNYLQYKSGSYIGTNSKTLPSFYIGFTVLVYFFLTTDASENTITNLKEYISEQTFTANGNQTARMFNFDYQGFYYMFASSNTNNLNVQVYNSDVTSTHTNSTYNTTKVMYVNNEYSNGVLNITYSSMWQGTLSFNRVPYNRSGRTYNWVAYGY